MRALLLTAVCLSAGPALAAGEDQQLWFTAWPGRAGSLSAEGAGETVVHLRWDVTSGVLPAGLGELRVYRDGLAIGGYMPAFETMTAEQIDALYALPENDRLRREQLRRLRDEVPGTPVPPETLGAIVWERLQDDPFWRWTTTRLDPVVAEASHRGMVDRDASGTVTYELRGVFGTAEVTLGSVEVDTAVPYRVPAARQLRQLAPGELARCDAPESGRAHGVVALVWDHPGAGAPERTAQALAIAGYDLWRTTAPAQAIDPALDLGALAAGRVHDADGRVVLPGLELVSRVPLAITSPLPDKEPGRDGWGPRPAQWLENSIELRRAGLRPGDRRAYYVVARDITGNYGETAGLAVTVPDLLRPAAPRGVRTLPRPAEVRPDGSTAPPRLVLRWPETNLRTELESHPHRLWCNLHEAAATRRLTWADGGSCPPERGPAPEGTGTLVEVSLDAGQYFVYRFSSFVAAARFHDSDGDGLDDVAEGSNADGPGDACVPAAVPGGARLPGTAEVRTLADGTRWVEFVDEAPAAQRGNEFWYRVAAASAQGETGELSPPVRGYFPDYEPVPRTAYGEPGGPVCDPAIHVGCAAGAECDLACDTTDRAASFRVSCKGEEQASVAFGPVVAGVARCVHGTAECAVLGGACAGRETTVEFLDAQGRSLRSEVVPSFSGSCADLSSRLYTRCEVPVADDPGQELASPFDEIDPEQGCVGIYHEVRGRMNRVRVVCGDEEVDDGIPVSALGGGLVCVFASTRGQSIGTTLPLGCVETPEPSLDPPQPVSFDFATDPGGVETASVRFRTPIQRIAGTLVTWQRKDGSSRGTTFVPQPADPGDLREMSATVDLGTPRPAAGAREEWCFQGRSIAAGTDPDAFSEAVSETSATRCGFRLGPGAAPPVHLPWPAIPGPRPGPPLEARYLSADQLPVVALKELTITDPECRRIPDAPGSDWRTCQIDRGAPSCLGPEMTFPCGCASIRSRAVPQQAFVVWRQHRTGLSASASDYVQVSPRVELVHCEAVNGAGALKDPFLDVRWFADVEPFLGLVSVFVDRFPHVVGEQYRYQIVYFDTRGEPSTYRTSGWITAVEP